MTDFNVLPVGFAHEVELELEKMKREKRPQVVPQHEQPSRVSESEIRKALKAAAKDQAAIRKALR